MKLVLINQIFANRFKKMVGEIIQKEDLLQVWTPEEIEFNFERMKNIYYVAQIEKPEKVNLKKSKDVSESTDTV